MPNVVGTKTLEFLLDLPEGIRYVVIEGSTRSGKTVATFQFLDLECIEAPDTTVRVFRHDGATHKDTTVPTFDFTMMDQMFNLYDSAGTYNKSDRIYKFKNRSQISFDAANEPQKLQGKESSIAFLNEAMEITFDAFTQIDYRCTDLVIFDFNPSLNQHWIFDKILSRAKKVAKPGAAWYCLESGVAYIHSTYEDNPCLTDGQISAIESYDPDNPDNVRNGTANAWKWDVYGLGKRGKVEGQIFTAYQVTEEWPDRHVCQKWGFALDFGSVDPMALSECRYYNNKLYVRELVYETGLLTTKNISKPNIPSLVHELERLGIDKNSEIVADCARPDLIKDLVTCGYNVIPCDKSTVNGIGSIKAGIDLLRGFMIMIHVDSNNMLMEFEQYQHKKHANGHWLEEPIDKHNHLIDGLRYWARRNLSSPKKYMSQKPGKQIKVKSRARDRRR